MVFFYMYLTSFLSKSEERPASLILFFVLDKCFFLSIYSIIFEPSFHENGWFHRKNQCELPSLHNDFFVAHSVSQSNIYWSWNVVIIIFFRKCVLLFLHLHIKLDYIGNNHESNKNPTSSLWLRENPSVKACVTFL